MAHLQRAHPAVTLMHRVEGDAALDRLEAFLGPVAERLTAPPALATALQGQWLGHAIHPLLTDFPLGMWMSGTLLDLVGTEHSRPEARRLIGLGVLAALPTAATGLAEWATLGSRRERRTGSLHAVINGSALALYAGSWLARRAGRHRLGTSLAVTGGLAATTGGYLGGHLTEVRKVSSHHPGFDTDPGEPTA